MKKLISILGSTGSVGLTTLEIVDKKKNYFKPYIFFANKNFKLICKQIIKYKPVFYVINDKKTFKKVKERFNRNNTKILNYIDLGIIKKKSDIAISAIPGIAGLKPTLNFVKLSKKMLIANKEAVICGWSLLKKDAKKYNTKIVPVDSEHFSIFTLLKNHKLDEIKKVFLTASGGPFLNYKIDQFLDIKPKDALKHPKWKMGKKITIDSATMMNKILELIEAQKLFKIPIEKLDILIHPESLIHAIIDFKNGLKKFIYHDTSMIIPLANGIFDGKLNIDLFYRIKKYSKLQNISFKKVNKKIFPILKVKDRINEYPSTSIIINASNEVLVDHFLRKKLPFLTINKIIMSIMNDKNYKKYAIKNPVNINRIIKIDNWARQETLKKIRTY